MQISEEDKHTLLTRLDNIRILKLLQEYGWSLEAFSNEWILDYSGCTQDTDVFCKALETIFGSENVKVLYENIENEISEFMGIDFKINDDYPYNYYVAVKSRIINDLINDESKKIIEKIINEFDSCDPYTASEYAIRLLEPGFVIAGSTYCGYSAIVSDIADILVAFGHIKKKTLELAPLPRQSEIRITLKPDNAYIEIDTAEGLKIEKNIHPIDLIRALVRHSAVPEEFKTPEPTIISNTCDILPHTHKEVSVVFTKTTFEINYEVGQNMDYEYGIQYTPRVKETARTIGVVVPAGKYTYNYRGELFEIPFPQMLFVFSLREGKLQKCQVFALQKGQVTKQSKLYRFPFGNVGINGAVCFGENILPTFNGLQELETFFRFVLAMEHNDDYFISPDDKVQRELVEKLSKENEFDNSLLIECGTVESLLS